MVNIVYLCLAVLYLAKAHRPCIIYTFGIYLFPILEVGYFIMANQTDIMTDAEETLMKIRDPLFVIETSLQIIKQRDSNDKIAHEINRIEAALQRISQIIK
ncbi:MAG: hypothetical protein ABI337_09970 [Nitrososphaera sp.]